MSTSTRSLGRTAAVAVRSMIVLTVLVIAYGLVITAVGQLLWNHRANGSMVTDASGEVVGSALLGQSFADPAGNPLPEYFQPRPSAAGDGYDATSSAGSNAGPENPDLIAAIEQRRAEVAAFNRIAPEAVPADAVTASASGLDPDISPAHAGIQVRRVAEARGLPVSEVQDLVIAHTQDRDLGFLGEPRVNVLELNIALDRLGG
ncbi:potassium-transporting ATPase subunit KdpC [Naumannella halotolerans]|uniref:Potassium-transporting ATPase KdpC subunit n=1 Tax=Naumannella halotolerans TaxID=993414 RepID=A0A4R7JD33_9ACTN|nr:potassium-transporting ATPase subunit KdpC [Naumannella halotolerans]TDT34389.1 K+-transporting ATPase ATPase C chain [Naumannella halotolerans]